MANYQDIFHDLISNTTSDGQGQVITDIEGLDDICDEDDTFHFFLFF